MERVGRLIGKLRVSGEALDPEDLVRTAWPGAVGKKIALHARASRMVRDRLIVEVEDRVWQKQLFALTPMILKNLQRELGPGMVEDIEFRVVPRRIEPQLASRSTQDRGQSLDEADQIADPYLREIYRRNRKRTQA